MVPSEPVAPPPVGVGQKPVGRAPATADLRAGRPYLLKSVPLRSLVRRVAAIAVLAGLDALGLALGLYAALVLRSIVFGDPIFWNLLWEAGPGGVAPVPRADHLARLLAGGALRRAGAARGRRQDRLVDRARRRDHARVRLGHELRLHHVRPDPDGLRHLGARDRAPACGVRVVDARAAAAAARAAPGPARGRGIASRVARAGADLAAARARVRPRRLVRARTRRPAGSASGGGAAGRDRPQRGRLRRGNGARAGRDGAPDGRARADRAEDDRAAAAARRVRARPGRAALRAPAARARGSRLGGQEGVRSRRQLRRRAPRAAVLAPDRGRDQARLARPRPLPRPPRRRRRGGVRDAQVPDDGAGRRRAAGGAGGAERGRRSALQDPRRPARDPRGARAPAAVDRRAAAGAERPRAAR